MRYNILAVGDVVGQNGLRHLKKHLREVQKLYDISFTVVNGENAQMVGLTREDAEVMFSAGADVITLGNHTFGKMSIAQFLDDCPYILRPANLGDRAPGRGCGVFGCGHIDIRVINLIGRVDMKSMSDNPFKTVDRLLGSGEKPRFTLVDFHAEATSEKLAMAYYLDGRVSALWGTHTHVPTADEEIFPKGTGYISDIGMTGPVRGVLGVDPQQSVEGFLGGLPGRYRSAEGECKLQGVVFSLDDATGFCTSVERITIM
ncbi:MAG: TIGR00282 family metallophosphoesterase [Oscillospiraceae bacterium]|nr:TIGR00282 family metallophosphoesterase [Oscillospiraceae bacterium]